MKLTKTGLCVLLGMLFVPLAWDVRPARAATENAIPVTGVEGYGKTREKALADAFQNAVRTALGTYVLSSSVDDGETVDEKIYLNADAIVESHKIVSQRTEDGLVVVVIDASVVRNEMMKYIERIPSVEVGEGELANLLNKRKAIDTAAQSLDLLFANWQQNLYRAEKFGPLSIAGDDSLAGGKIKVSVPFILTLDWENYRVWKQKMMTLLDRINVAKTTGRCRDYGELNYIYSEETGFFDETGLSGENPNKYRAVLFVDEWPGPGVGYTLYAVPFQIHQKLAKILDTSISLRFAFSDAAGETLASESIPGTLAFFQWAPVSHRWISSLRADAVDGAYLLDDVDECLVFREKLGMGGSDDGCVQKCYHAVVPIGEAAAMRMRECSIQCGPAKSKRSSRESFGDRLSVTTLSKEEWRSIDPNPGGSGGGGALSGGNGAPEDKLAGLAEALETAMYNPTGANYKKLEDVWQMLPEKEKTATQKNVMWALCAMLASQGHLGAAVKRQGLINYPAFLIAVSDRCHACGGAGRSQETCRTCGGVGVRRGRCGTCGGTGDCSFCHGSGRTGGRLGGAPLRCPKCGGSGRCGSCSGGWNEVPCSDCRGGSTATGCRTCNGTGRIVSADKCERVVEENLEQALRICSGF